MSQLPLQSPGTVPVPGLWLTVLGPAALAAVLADEAARPRWLGIDLQHGEIAAADLPDLLRCAELHDTPVLVRTADHSAAAIGRALDLGARGVVVPAVERAGQAASIVAATRFAPDGVRSDGYRRPRARSTGLPGFSDPLVLPMVETAAGLAAAGDILGVDGVSGVFVGPIDLARSAGWRPDGPELLAAVADLSALSRDHERRLAMFALSAEHAATLPPLDLVALGTDLGLLGTAVSHTFGEAR
ncbi:HpcH/HpaI aldolase family protein [Nocardioides nitrophenolicus]|uniref:HpcH/HpaI aldolase family protein n=1 Tax=Nocardioides nitrophenolicus TaxID=60489 RepID=UPI001961210E|nr:aldolase/citrate lyase family protein [Nocardioides nitrophenolicus]MBM7520441.1 4-hydroxy-2-oxoheptanedioate aldolase [Nocardioides nitrophenolicus]